MKVLLLPFKLLFLSRGSQSRTDWLYHSCGTVPCKPQWPAEAGNQEVSREQQLLWLLRQTKCASSAGGSWQCGARRSECASSPGRSSGARQSECASLSWEILAVWGKAEWVCKLILGDPGSVGQGGVSVLGEVYGETVSQSLLPVSL